jgi:hypothetical protein
MIKELVKIANELDSRGLSKEADYLDTIISKGAGNTIENSIGDIGEGAQVSQNFNQAGGSTGLPPEEWSNFLQQFNMLDDKQNSHILNLIGDGGSHDAVPEGVQGDVPEGTPSEKEFNPYLEWTREEGLDYGLYQDKAQPDERGYSGPEFPGPFIPGKGWPEGALVNLPPNLLEKFVEWGVIGPDQKSRWETVQEQERETASWWQVLNIMKPTESYQSLIDLGLQFASNKEINRSEFDQKQEAVFLQHEENMGKAKEGSPEGTVNAGRRNSLEKSAYL